MVPFFNHVNNINLNYIYLFIYLSIYLLVCVHSVDVWWCECGSLMARVSSPLEIGLRYGAQVSGSKYLYSQR